MATPFTKDILCLTEGLMYIKMQLPYEREMTIMWEEQVEKAFFLWLVEGIFKIVRAIYVYDRITNTKVIRRVTKAKTKLIISNKCVSVQVICRRGAVSE